MRKQERFHQKNKSEIQETVTVFAFVGDALAIVIGLFFAFWFRFKSGWIPFNPSWWTSGGSFQDRSLVEYAGVIGVGGFLLMLSLVQLRMYQPENLLRFRRLSMITLRAVSIWTFIYFGVSLVLRFNPPISRIYVLSSSIAVFFSVIAWRYCFNKVLTRTSMAGKLRQRVVFVGWNEQCERLAQSIFTDVRQPYEIVGHLPWGSADKELLAISGVPRIGRLDELGSLVHKHSIDIVVLSEPRGRQEDVVELINICARLMVKMKVGASFFQILIAGLRLETISSVPILGIADLPLDHIGNRMVKRTIDIVGAVVGLVGSIPIFVVIGGMIFYESPGPILFRQERVGRGGRKFKMLKLRSMTLDADKADHLNQSTLREDPRLLRIGAFIRKWNLDEVPQFYNVLVGQMSLVGPRPERTFHAEDLSFKIPYYNSRLMCKPGITGWAQVNGLRGDTDLAERVRCDLFYLENWSIWLDIQIMIQTFVSRKNAY